ncbi:something about silencing protein 10 [Silurus asotus]|uniref:Something about silencing protein 10 n=1 Tax=Silurus asotus TaxID=30991 RepID=A0AAD5AE12_SILAS|nr:something about silencing protein 10 [Silurus asotus]
MAAPRTFVYRYTVHPRKQCTVGKCIKVVRRLKAKKVEEYDSDDPACYENEEIPDKRSSESMQDKIEHFHNAKISNLLAQGVQLDSEQEDEADEDEVMPLTLEDSDDEEEEENSSNEEHEETDMESDLEGKRDDDLPNDMAWGSKKKMYYDSDYTTKKGKPLEEVEADDQEEEEEAKNIQKRLAANLSEEDYDLNLLQEFAVEIEDEKTKKAAEKEQRIVKDLNTMSQKEKLKLLKKESPELLELIQDFKAKMTELRDEIQPIVQMVRSRQIPPGKVSKVADMEKAEESDSDEEAALLFYKGIEERLKLKRKNKQLPEDGLMIEQEEEAQEQEEMDGEAKRGITYQMAKNKGLTPKRKKIDRNPRVKHREKFRRAKIRRKGQVLQVRREETRYSGELSGIRAGIKKSIKLK